MKKILIISSLLLSNMLFGQQLTQSSLYMYNGLYYNPAYAGTRNSISASLIAREQWVGLDGAPSTQYLSVHSPIRNGLFSIGGHFVHDNIGSRKKTSGYVDLNAGIKVTKNIKMNVGISLGVDSYVLGFSDLTAYDQGDALAILEQSATKFNTGAGVYFYSEKFYFGFSIPKVVEQNLEVGNTRTNIAKRHYYLTGGYVFNLNSVFDFKPSVLVKYVENAPLTFDLNASFLMYKKIWVGGMYRFDESVGLNLVFHIKKMFSIGYAYDFPINGLRGSQSGSHEVLLQFDFSKYDKQNKIYSPRYF